jgi:kynureninase
MPDLNFDATPEFARTMDQADPLRAYQKQFLFPQQGGEDVIYFCGNSLGLQSKGVQPVMQEELNRWSALGIDGFFEGDTPWLKYHEELSQNLAPIVGASPSEVIVMNTLTVNLHLMLVSFYRPTDKRFKIIMEAGAFPSDQYALETQVTFHGYDPAEAIIEVAPRPGEELLHDDDILQAIEEHGEELALVLFGGVNYYTGQVYDLAAITKAGHRVGAMVGFDLAHGAGNVPLHLHEWGVDFAVWCSYKYLNSGPGGPGGVFVHDRHARNPGLPRFAGWWGYEESTRFLMRKGFKPAPGAAGWQLSTPNILTMVPHRVSLQLFAEAGFHRLREKSIYLTSYLEFLIGQLPQAADRFRIITPRESNRRGCQLSILTSHEGKDLFDHLIQNGIILDWREHNLPDSNGQSAGVIRVAPTPLYCSYQDVYRFVELVEEWM